MIDFEKYYIANIVQSTKDLKNGEIYQFNFRDILNQINIEDILDLLRINHKITCVNTLKMIKRSFNTINCNIKEGNKISNLLSNVVMHDLDIIVNDLNEYNKALLKGTDRQKKNPYLKFYSNNPSRVSKMDELKYRKMAKGRLQIKLIHLSKEGVVVSPNRFDVPIFKLIFKRWTRKFNLKIHEEKTVDCKENNSFKLKLSMYNYSRIKNDKVIISPSKLKEEYSYIRRKIREFLRKGKFNLIEGLITNTLTRFNICSNLGSYINNIIYIIRRNYKKYGFKKEPNRDIWTINGKTLDIWKLRSKTKKSYSYFLKPIFEN